jgi:hypothetical protein
MAHKSDHCKDTTDSEKDHESQDVTAKVSTALTTPKVYSPSSVIRAGLVKKGFRVFIARVQAALAELSSANRYAATSPRGPFAPPRRPP